MRYFWAYQIKKQWAERIQRNNPDFVASENSNQYNAYLQKGIGQIEISTLNESIRLDKKLKTSENARLCTDWINRLYAEIKAVDYAKHYNDAVNWTSTSVKTLLNKLN